MKCGRLAAAAATTAFVLCSLYWLYHLWYEFFDGGEAVHGIGHRKPFGNSRFPQLAVPQQIGFAAPRKFHDEFVLPLRPLLMRAAVKETRAFRFWDDDYFLSLRLQPEESKVHVETIKKERRDQRTYDVPFKDFVRSYNHSGHYMVASMPQFLTRDFPLPWSLQCPGVEAAIVEAIVWFSSGGTSSVVHTDAVDNVNCVIRGNKTFVMVDPALYGDRVPIDNPNGAYSSIDVDSVDFRAYPGIADVQYHVVHMQPGDCLYIPYKWIHQVRSYGRNIAVNIWFDKSLLLHHDNCSSSWRQEWLLDSGNFKGFDYRPPAEVLADVVQNVDTDFNSLLSHLVPEHEEWRSKFGGEFIDSLMRVFAKLDKNQNSLLEPSELKNLPAETLQQIDTDFMRFDKFVRTVHDMLNDKDEL